MSGQVLNERATIDLEVGNFEANSKKVVNLLNQIKAAANGAAPGLNNAGAAAGAANAKMAAYGKTLAALRSGMTSLNGTIGKLNTGITGLGQHMTTLSAASQRNTSAINQNTASLGNLGAHIATLQASIDKLTHATDANTAATANAGGAARTTASSFSALGGIIGALSFGLLAKEAVQLTDAYRGLQARLSVTTSGLASSSGAMADVSRIANDTRSSIEAIGSLYSKVSMSGKHFGATQGEVARVTETVAKGLGVMGATAMETESTILQLGQALASGRLQGDEFRSMTENAPALMEILAKATGKPRAELKKLATDGKLTSQIIISAFGSQSEAIKQLDADYAKMPLTVAQAWTLVKNKTEEALGTNANMVSSTRAIADSFQLLANNMETVIPVIATLSTAIGVNMVRSMIAASLAAGTLKTSLIGFARNAAISLGITALIAGLAYLTTTIMDSNRETNTLAQAASSAGHETKKSGVEALVAATGVARFGGQVGAAAGKLWDMASAARSAAIETARLNFTKASAAYHRQAELTDSGFVNAQNADNAVLTDSNASIGERAGAIGSQIGRGIRKLGAPRQSVVRAAQTNAFGQMKDSFKELQEVKAAPMASFIPTIDPAASTDPKKTGGKKGSKEDRLGDFWRDLEHTRDLASMISPELETQNKLFDLQDILMDKLGKKYAGISAIDKKRVEDLMEQTRAAKLVVDINEKTRSLNEQTAQESDAMWARANGATDEQITKAKALSDFQNEAIRQKINLEGESYKAAMKTYDDALDKANQLKAAERGIAEARAASPAYANSLAMTAFDQRRNDVNAAVNAPNSTLTERDRTLALRAIDNDQRELENRFYTGMGEQISSISEMFGKKMGAQVDKLGKLLTAITKAASGDFSGFGAFGSLAKFATTNRDGSMNSLGAGISDSMQNTLGGMARQLGLGNRKTDKVADATTDTAASNEEIVVLGKKLPGDLAQTLTAAMVGAGIGGAIGGTAGSIGGALGGAAMKEFAGKALGAFAGPLGGIIGGLAGSLIGGLFKSKKQGTSTLMIGDDGLAYGGTATGKGSAAKKQAQAMGGSLAGQLNDIASSLGATLGSANVSIGYRPGHKDPAYRVDTSGKGRVTGVQAFETEAEAIAFALKDALQDGVLVGLSDFAQKAVGALDIDAAVSLVNAFKNITDELDAMNDPIGAGVRSINKDLDSLRDQMVKVGASANDLGSIEQLRSKKLAAYLEQTLQPLTDLQKSFNSTESGTPLKKQLDTARAEYERYKTDISLGKTVDQDKYSSAASTVNSLTAQLYGTAGSLYTDVKSDLSTTTASLATLITNMVNGGGTAGTTTVDPTTTAISEQTAQLVGVANQQLAEQQRTNALLKAMTANDNSNGGVKTVNGRMANY